jgi:hypothetical protein
MADEIRKLPGAEPRVETGPSTDVNELQRICSEAYQVVGSLLSDLGKFDTPEAEKILDNLSQQRLVHDDVLPWPSYGVDEELDAAGVPKLPLTLLEQQAIAALNMIKAWRDMGGDGNVPFPDQARQNMEAALMLATMRRKGVQ